MREKIIDINEAETKFTFVESKDGEMDIVDGEHVLARVKGPFFVPNGKSRNGRFYPKSLWEKVLSDPNIKRKFTKKLMFGTIGHDGELTEKAIREGMISHIVIGAEIDPKNKGIGEALILNTPAGKILNTILRAGSELAVSSRANGTFKGKHKGLPIVDEETYDLDGWDFVIDPGFLEAQPEITESLQELYKQYNIKEHEGDDPMDENNSVDKTLVEHIANENADLKNKVSNLTDEIETLKDDNKTVAEENANLKVELGKMEEMAKEIETFKELGTAEEIKEKFDKSDEDGKVLESFQELADTPEDAKSALEESVKYINEIKETFNSLEEAKTAKETLTQYEELGEVEKVKSALLKFKAFIDERSAADKEVAANKLAEELNVPVEKVNTLLEKYDEEAIRSLYKVVNEDDSEKYRKKNEDNTDLDEDVDPEDDAPKGKSLAEMIGESLAPAIR